MPFMQRLEVETVLMVGHPLVRIVSPMATSVILVQSFPMTMDFQLQRNQKWLALLVVLAGYFP
jgi:hypothetical protein